MVGTELAENLAEIILEKGESYVGNAQVLGVDHLCSYVPTHDESGQVNGLIFAGISFRSFSGIYLPDFCFTGISIWTRASSILSITFSLIITS